MKEFYIDDHAHYCHSNPSNPNRKDFDYCGMNPHKFLFFLEKRFFIVNYHDCIGGYDGYEYKKMLVEALAGQIKELGVYEVNRSVDVRKELRDFRIRNKNLRKNIQQVNCLYCDNAGKQYAITTTVKFNEWLCNQSEIDENYKNARKYIEENEYLWLLGYLDSLYLENRVSFNVNDVEIMKTIDHLIKKINLITK